MLDGIDPVVKQGEAVLRRIHPHRDSVEGASQLPNSRGMPFALLLQQATRLESDRLMEGAAVPFACIAAAPCVTNATRCARAAATVGRQRRWRFCLAR